MSDMIQNCTSQVETQVVVEECLRDLFTDQAATVFSIAASRNVMEAGKLPPAGHTTTPVGS